MDPTVLDSVVNRQVYDLGTPYNMGMPVHPSHPPYVFTLQRRHGDTMRPGGLGSANELIVMCGHTGTHLDALAHFARDGIMCGGLEAVKVQSGGRGMTEHGIERVPPIVRRGVLLDVAGAEGVDILPNDFAITADVAQAVAREHGVEVRKDDAFLVRTGLMQRWNDPSFLDLENGQPGITADCAEWLAETGVYLGGADTMTFEFIPAGDERLPVHGIFLVDHGIHILENADLESLAAAGVHEFLFVMSPLKIVGATASPVRPIAIA